MIFVSNLLHKSHIFCVLYVLHKITNSPYLSEYLYVLLKLFHAQGN